MLHEQPPNEQQSFVGETIFACYSIATLAASIVTFGELGIALGLIVTAFWACAYVIRSCWLRVLSIVAVVFIGIVFLLPPFHGNGHLEATWRMSCLDNLKHLALALHNYHDEYKSFPPAHIKGEDGRLLHSWRVLILPYLENQQHLLRRLRLFRTVGRPKQ